MGFFLAGTVATRGWGSATVTPGGGKTYYHGIVEEFRLFDALHPSRHPWHPEVISSSCTVGTLQQQSDSLGAIQSSSAAVVPASKMIWNSLPDSSHALVSPAAGGASAYHQRCLNGKPLHNFLKILGSRRLFVPEPFFGGTRPYFRFSCSEKGTPGRFSREKRVVCPILPQNGEKRACPGSLSGAMGVRLRRYECSGTITSWSDSVVPPLFSVHPPPPSLQARLQVEFPAATEGVTIDQPLH